MCLLRCSSRVSPAVCSPVRPSEVHELIGLPEEIFEETADTSDR